MKCQGHDTVSGDVVWILKCFFEIAVCCFRRSFAGRKDAGECLLRRFQGQDAAEFHLNCYPPQKGTSHIQGIVKTHADQGLMSGRYMSPGGTPQKRQHFCLFFLSKKVLEIASLAAFGRQKCLAWVSAGPKASQLERATV